LKSFIGGTLYLCRLDYASMGRKLESLDGGFSSYTGFIHMECAHRHPILLCFTSLLLRTNLDRSETVPSSRAKLRWLLILFLSKNPSMVFRRKAFLARSNALKPVSSVDETLEMGVHSTANPNQFTA
jgi:hypothetical protein